MTELYCTLLVACIASPLPPLVERAENFPEDPPPVSWREAPEFRQVEVAGRDPKRLREWRDQRQQYAIFWTAGGYRPREIVGRGYDPLAGRVETRHATFGEARAEVLSHWRFRTQRSKPPLARVEPAQGFPAELAQASPKPPWDLRPILTRVEVAGRDPKRLREWRDQRQQYAVLWMPSGYRALEILREGRYQPLSGCCAQTFDEAHAAVDRHWRLMTGRSRKQ